jgi:hypothetical protein
MILFKELEKNKEIKFEEYSKPCDDEIVEK